MDEERGGRSLAGSLFRWGRRHGPDPAAAGAEGEGVSTKALAKFLGALANREGAVVLDLGPVVGSNISFLGERLGCKFLVEDVFADVERFTKERRLDALPSFLTTRFSQSDASVDGILCWDVFDFLDRPAAQELARQLIRLLKPGGALLAFFATTPPAKSAGSPHYTRFVIADDTTLQHRHYGGSRERQPVLNNRDITRLFDGLRVADSFLLLTKTREILFRKPDRVG